MTPWIVPWQALLDTAHSPDEESELEEDMVLLLAALASTFDPDASFHQHNQAVPEVRTPMRFSYTCCARVLLISCTCCARVLLTQLKLYSDVLSYQQAGEAPGAQTLGPGKQ